MAHAANLVWAVLAEKKVISEAEARALSENLDHAAHPTDLETAEKMVRAALDDAERAI
jgi:hypothetical protein